MRCDVRCNNNTGYHVRCHGDKECDGHTLIVTTTGTNINLYCQCIPGSLVSVIIIGLVRKLYRCVYHWLNTHNYVVHIS